MIFTNREDAGQQLANALVKYAHRGGVVVAIPRGGVPVGRIVSKALSLPLDIFPVKKIGHPLNPEYAIGAVTLTDYYIDSEEPGVTDAYILEQVANIRSELQRRYHLFTGRHEVADFRGKTVILTDDGIATGSTLRAAVKSMRQAGAAKIVIATPVAPPQAEQLFRPLCDEYICLQQPADFSGVGQFYLDFPQVSDEEVAHHLDKAAHPDAY